MENKKDKRLIKIIVSIIIVLILLLILVITRLRNVTVQENKELDRIKSYTTIDDFKTVEEVAKYLECDYIKQEKSKVENYNLDFYIKIKLLPYTDNNSNESFYNKLISYSAKVLKYDNFRIIDRENNNIIEVVCDKEKENIKTIIINGESNYFAKRDSEIQMNNFKQVKETNLTIQSDILTKLISNNWRIKESDIGTKESTFNSYDIYFDEGIELRKIDNRVFNIVFTDKYKLNIVNNITTDTSKEDIIKILGEPTFKDGQTGVIGYKGKEVYVFFNTEKQISIYKVVQESKEDKEFSELLDKYIEDKNTEDFMNKIKQIWNDYDESQVNGNKKELRYSLKGIEVTNNSVNIYSNFSTNIYKEKNVDEFKNEILTANGIIFQNSDLVLKNETNRNKSLNSRKYVLENFVTSEYDDDTNSNSIKSSEFLEYKNYSDENTFSVKFISKTGSYPNSELKQYVNNGLWINDYIYIYSIANSGIYAYNTRTRNYATLVTGNEEFKNLKYENNKLFYDDKQINFR